MGNRNIGKFALIILFIVFGVVLVWAIADALALNYHSLLDTRTQVQFNQTEIDIGKLKQGQPETVKFELKNTGVNPLIIQQVETSCGCTKLEWTKHPIKPNQFGEIKVTYDAKYPGRFVKGIMVFRNTEKAMEKLVVKGEVEEEKN